MPANATGHEQRQRPIQRSNHLRRVITMRNLQHSFHSDRHQAHAPIPLETMLDKYLLRWFLRRFDLETSKPQCCHNRGWLASLWAPSCPVFMRAA
jgi:hypothetical protein